VHFPGFGSSADFWVTIAFIAVTIVGMLGFFRYKRWL
jgi:hypothetical protein